MIRSKILQLTVATALLAGAQSAVACSTAAWTGGATATAGEPLAGTGTPNQFRRYSGRCGITSSAAAQTVIDNSPNTEVTYKARFYFYTGGLTAPTADIFQAKNTGGTNVIRVTYDGSNLGFISNGGTPATVAAVANRVYGIEVRWAAATGTTTAVVRGNAAATATTVNATGAVGQEVSSAVLGWISGGTLPAGANPPTFDEFDSRRTSDIGFLCRGNAQNADTNITLADRIAINNNILGSALAIGQPDANEDGLVTLADRIAVNNIILAGTGTTICGGVN